MMNKFLKSVIFLISVAGIFNSQCGNLKDAVERLDVDAVASLLKAKKCLKKERKEKLLALTKKRLKVYGAKTESIFKSKKDLVGFLLGAAGLAFFGGIFINFLREYSSLIDYDSWKEELADLTIFGASMGLAIASLVKCNKGCNLKWAFEDYNKILRINGLIKKCPTASQELNS